MAVTVTVEAIGRVAMTDHLENPVVRGQVLASHLHRLPPATVDAERKSLPAVIFSFRNKGVFVRKYALFL